MAVVAEVRALEVVDRPIDIDVAQRCGLALQQAVEALDQGPFVLGVDERHPAVGCVGRQRGAVQQLAGLQGEDASLTVDRRDRTDIAGADRFEGRIRRGIGRTEEGGSRPHCVGRQPGEPANQAE